MRSVTGKVAVVTGANTGIGQGMGGSATGVAAECRWRRRGHTPLRSHR